MGRYELFFFLPIVMKIVFMGREIVEEGEFFLPITGRSGFMGRKTGCIKQECSTHDEISV